MKISICTDIVNWGKDFFEGIDSLIDTGADAIEFWQWSDKDIPKLKKYIKEKKIVIPGFCLDSSDVKISELCFGNLMSGGMTDNFIAAIKESINVAKELNAGFLIATVGDRIDELNYSKQISNIKNCINAVTGILDENNITLLLEPICHAERSEYLISESEKMLGIIKDIGSDNVKLLYDVYHQYNTGDYSADFITKNIKYIGHIHIADVPGRHEIGSGEIDFKNLLTKLDKLDYNRYIGFEYIPLVESCKETINKVKKMMEE